MRFILSMLMMTALALSLACQNASSSSTETKNEKTAADKTTEKPAKKTDAKKAEKKADNPSANDGNGNGMDEAPRISLADAKKAFDTGEAVFVDTRSANLFQNERIKGAINISKDDFENAYNKVPKGKKIIVYCS